MSLSGQRGKLYFQDFCSHFECLLSLVTAKRDSDFLFKPLVFFFFFHFHSFCSGNSSSTSAFQVNGDLAGGDFTNVPMTFNGLGWLMRI